MNFLLDTIKLSYTISFFVIDFLYNFLKVVILVSYKKLNVKTKSLYKKVF